MEVFWWFTVRFVIWKKWHFSVWYVFISQQATKIQFDLLWSIKCCIFLLFINSTTRKKLYADYCCRINECLQLISGIQQSMSLKALFNSSVNYCNHYLNEGPKNGRSFFNLRNLLLCQICDLNLLLMVLLT